MLPIGASSYICAKIITRFKPKIMKKYLHILALTLCGMTAQGATDLPWDEDFSNPETFDALTAYDGDWDGYTWELVASMGVAHLPGQPFERTSDYLITPEFSFSTDRLYVVEADFKSEWAANYPFTLTVYVGNGLTDAGYTRVVYDSGLVRDPENVHIKAYIQVEDAGDYRVAIKGHGYDIQDIELRNLSVREGSMLSAPTYPSAITAVAAPMGADSATVCFNTPVTDIAGNPLDALSEARVYRNGRYIGYVQDIQPGAEYQYADDAPVPDTVNRYSVAVVNDYGEGLDCETSVFVGIDTPLAPANVHLADNGDTALLSWEAPQCGVNGGYVPADGLTYHIFNGQTGKETVTTQTSLEMPMSQTGAQDWYYFTVSASTSTGTGAEAMSNPLVSGSPYQTPYYEGFPDGGRSSFWGARQVPEDNNWSSWGVQSTYDADADSNSGVVYYTGGQKGNRSHLFSGKIDISKSTNPILEFAYIYRDEEGDATFNTYIIVNGNDTTLVDSRDYSHYHEMKPWESVRIPLAQFKDSHYIQLLFEGTSSATGVTMIKLDAIGVRDQHEHDLMLDFGAVPAAARSGAEVALTARITNIGSETAGGSRVVFYDGDTVIAAYEQGELQPDASADIAFSYSVPVLEDTCSLWAEVEYSADEDTANNSSVPVTVEVILPEYPAPAGLVSAHEAGDVSLEWNAPDYLDFTVSATEGAESLQDGSADLGDWTTVDRDGANTISQVYLGWDPYRLPGMGSPMGFMVLDPVANGVPSVDWFGDPTGWDAYEGDKFFVSYANAAAANDDWLVSPELTGSEQTVTFAVSGGVYDPWGVSDGNGDTYELLYSESDTDVESFVSLGTFTAPALWETRSVDVPEGGRYFAIRHNTPGNGTCLRIDNIVCQPLSNKGALQLTGYNVYCDRELVANTATTRYTHAGAADSWHTYHVSAVYTLGESAAVRTDIESGVENPSASELTEVGRYTVDGLPVSGLHKGMVIVRYSDGSARKIIAK